MLNKQTYFKPRGFYQKKEEIMSGRGRGNKSRKRDLIDAPKITSAPAKISNKGNLPKKLKADAKKSRSTRTPTPPPVVPVHGQFSSSDESEAEEQQNRAVESSSDDGDGGMSPVEEIPIPEGLGDDDDEGGDEEEEDFSWKCRLLEFIQQYPEVFDKANPRYKKKNLREAAWEEIATAMDSDGI